MTRKIKDEIRGELDTLQAATKAELELKNSARHNDGWNR
jgi:hypothetical protein